MNAKIPTYNPNSGIAKTSRACSLLLNNNSISEKFATISSRYEVMYMKRAFVFWYVSEGMEEGKF